jgi:hypothetical protein
LEMRVEGQDVFMDRMGNEDEEVPRFIERRE